MFPGDQKFVQYLEEDKKELAAGFEIVPVKIPAISVLVGPDHLQNAGDGSKRGTSGIMTIVLYWKGLIWRM